MKSILLFGYYGQGNFGDDLILETLAETLAQPYRVSAIAFSDRQSHKTQELVGLRKLNLVLKRVIRRRFLSKFNALYQAIQVVREGRHHDALVFGGGTQIFETVKNGFLPLLTQTLFTTVLRRFYGKTIGHLFVGINKPETRVGAYLVRRILAVSDFIVLRDQRSYDVCLALGTPAEKLFLAADTAYLRTVTDRIATVDGPKKIGVSLFPYFARVARNPAKDEAFLARAIAAVSAETANTPRGTELIFFGSQPGSALDDIKYLRGVADKFIAETGCRAAKFVDYERDTNAMFDALGQMDCVVAMRLHILISSAIAGVPKILALPYQTKVFEEAKALGLPIIQNDTPAVTPDATGSALAHRKEQCEQALTWMAAMLADEQDGTDSK
ncbi:polysaccharide pyruvyl transferase family protein [Martelella sp. FLE1502]